MSHYTITVILSTNCNTLHIYSFLHTLTCRHTLTTLKLLELELVSEYAKIQENKGYLESCHKILTGSFCYDYIFILYQLNKFLLYSRHSYLCIDTNIVSNKYHLLSRNAEDISHAQQHSLSFQPHERLKQDQLNSGVCGQPKQYIRTTS